MQPQPDSQQNQQPQSPYEQPTRVSFVSDFLKPRTTNLSPTPQQSSSPQTPEPVLNNPALATAEEQPSPPEPNPQHQLLEELRDERDTLRGTSPEPKRKNPKKMLLILGAVFASLIILSLSARAILSSNNQESAPATRQAFVLPSDLSSKPTEEQAALKIIDLARRNQPQEIIQNWLGAKDLNVDKTSFASLIESYSSAADGKTAELIEKQVGESNLGVQDAKKVRAASLIYKSNYFEHTNNVYLKLNFYQSTEDPASWKLYRFEFNADQNNAPLKAEL